MPLPGLQIPEPFLRLVIFLAVLGFMLLWEWRAPFRRFKEAKLRRLGRHLALIALNTVLVRVLSGGGAVVAAQHAAERGWGLFNYLGITGLWSLGLGLVLLDFAIYLQHVVFHKVPLLWRQHKVHHLDLGFDTTTAIRFHPAEILLSMYYKMMLVLALGVSPLAVLVFETLLNAFALFNHGNVHIPARWERRLRVLLVTPDLHRIHHSTLPAETDSNFGFCVPFWDRLCGTYRADPEQGQAAMNIGLMEERDPSRLDFGRLLILPFR